MIRALEDLQTNNIAIQMPGKFASRSTKEIQKSLEISHNKGRDLYIGI